MSMLGSEGEAADLVACRELLRGGSRSFYVASHLLPRQVRESAIALYAFCRVADDVIDREIGGGAGLAWLRERLVLIYAGRPLALPADRAFARVVERFAMPRALPEALLEGFAWDAEGRRYPDLSAVRSYAVRVAGTVGAMMAVLMGVRDAPRQARAIDLGVAMQLFNIARDVGEDARAGRLYLPTQWLEQVGIDPDAFLARPRHTEALGQVIRRLLDAAEDHALRARAGVGNLPLSCRLGIGAASLLYAEIGAEVVRRGLDAISGRAVVSGRRKAAIMARSLAGTAFTWQALGGAALPEGAFLVEAVAHTAPRTEAVLGVPWWDVATQIQSLFDLMEKLEQRERVRS
jgi:phytoene synthase